MAKWFRADKAKEGSSLPASTISFHMVDGKRPWATTSWESSGGAAPVRR
ncbi:MAG TPA: hypothetical protein DCE44_23830 [Verrucomicrobiales bacterium]|nr:hypothetical protein [Verrucomicrobiales bacterium]